MKYRIQEVSDMVGVTPQTIRFYEKYGILPADRGESGKQRRYSVIDINILMRSRMYRNAGFTLAESSELQNDVSVQGMEERYRNKAAELERELVWKQRVLNRMKQDADLLGKIEQYRYQVTETVSPAGYGMLYSLGGRGTTIAKELREKVRSWVNFMPVVQPLVYFYRDKLPSSGRNLGFFLPEEAGDYLEQLDSEGVFPIPPQKCVYTVLDGYTREHDSAFYVNAFLERLDREGIQLSGNPYGRVITSLDCGRTYHFYAEVWFPVG